MHLCAYVCMYACAHMCTYARMCECMYARMYVWVSQPARRKIAGAKIHSREIEHGRRPPSPLPRPAPDIVACVKRGLARGISVEEKKSKAIEIGMLVFLSYLVIINGVRGSHSTAYLGEPYFSSAIDFVSPRAGSAIYELRCHRS
jgi:hypothetical protein